MLQQAEGQDQLYWQQNNTAASVTHLQSDKPAASVTHLQSDKLNSTNQAQAGKS